MANASSVEVVWSTEQQCSSHDKRANADTHSNPQCDSHSNSNSNRDCHHNPDTDCDRHAEFNPDSNADALADSVRISHDLHRAFERAEHGRGRKRNSHTEARR